METSKKLDFYEWCKVLNDRVFDKEIVQFDTLIYGNRVGVIYVSGSYEDGEYTPNFMVTDLEGNPTGVFIKTWQEVMRYFHEYDK